MNDPVNKIILSDDEIKQYREGGVLKIKNLFPPESVERFRNIIEEEYDENQPLMGDCFSRLNYDIGNEGSHTKNVCRSKELKRIINSLIDERILFTQGIYFELEQSKSTGFIWHFGMQSFNYIMPTDLSYSIWIPLDEIDAKGQSGGMAYIPESDFSAKEDVKKTVDLYKHVSVGEIDGDPYGGGTMLGANDDLYDTIAREESFNLGDALIFNRFVWHKSVMLKPGPLKKRRAYVMRFISGTASYNTHLLEVCRERGHDVYSKYGDSFKDLGHGDLISSSEYANELI